MSFYTGKDNSNDAILHITNGVTPQASMKSGVLANSIFHSSLPYLELEVHKMIRVNATTLEAPISFINSVGSKQPFFLTVDGVLQNYAMDLFMYRWHSSSNVNNNWPTNTYKYIRKASTTEENYAYVIKNINNRNYVPFTPTANDIKIGGGEFSIKGKNLYDTIFLQNAVINSEDNAFYADNSNPIDNARRMQAINSKVIGSVEIKSDPSETYIARGGHKLFTSNNLAKSKYKEKTPAAEFYDYNRTSDWYAGCDTNAVITSPRVRVGVQASGLSDGDMFLLDWIPNNTEIYDMGLYKYKEGHIGYPSRWLHSELRLGSDFCDGTATCCDRISDYYCYSASSCFDCEHYEVCTDETPSCDNLVVISYDVDAHWELVGEGGQVVLYHQAVYTITADPCLCGCSGSAQGIFFTYSSWFATIKFY